MDEDKQHQNNHDENQTQMNILSVEHGELERK